MRAVAALLLFFAGTAAAAEPGAATRPPLAYVEVSSDGCNGSQAASETPETTWTPDGRAVNTRKLWLNSREQIHSGPVDVVVRGERVFAWIDVAVEPVSEQTTTCIYAIVLTLVVEELPPGEYEWILRRGRRADDTTLEQDIAAADAARAEANAREDTTTDATTDAN